MVFTFWAPSLVLLPFLGLIAFLGLDGFLGLEAFLKLDAFLGLAFFLIAWTSFLAGVAFFLGTAVLEGLTLSSESSEEDDEEEELELTFFGSGGRFLVGLVDLFLETFAEAKGRRSCSESSEEEESDMVRGCGGFCLFFFGDDGAALEGGRTSCLLFWAGSCSQSLWKGSLLDGLVEISGLSFLLVSSPSSQALGRRMLA